MIMKIVMFTDAYWPRVNGVTVSVDAFSHALMRAGHQVMIVCSSYPETSDTEYISGTGEPENIGGQVPQVIRVPSMPSPVTKEDRLALAHKWPWVSKQIENFNPDILHINSEFVIAEFGYSYGRLNYLPVIFTFHTLWEDYARNYIPLLPVFFLRFVARLVLKNVMRRADRVIVPTTQIMDVVKKYKIRKEVYLIPTGVDPRIFQREKSEVTEFRSRMEILFPALSGKRILLFAGRIAKEKNISFLLEILPEIRQKHPEVVLLIVGNGPDLYDLKEESEKLGISDSCIFSGYLARKDLALTYAMSDIFVFPSLTETQGMVTIEAMISGCPVVAIGEMGTLEVMHGDNGGFMVKNDKNEFVGCVLELLDDDDLYNRKVDEAKEHAKAWTIDAMTVKLQKVYQNAIDAWPNKHNS
jgi:glycosyltransferase involved in cell wall biosynthesis